MNDPLFSRPWWRRQLFALFARLAPKHEGPPPPLPDHPRRVLVLAPVALGDYLVLSPLLSALARKKPRTEVAVVVTRTSYELAAVDTNVHRILLYKKLPAWPLSMIEIIRYKPDVVVLPKGHPAFTESLLLAVTHAPFRVGLSHPHHDALLTHPVQHDWEAEHRSESFVRLLAPFGIDPTSVSRRVHIGTDPEAERFAETVIRRQPPGEPVIALNISATQPMRLWPLNKWKALVRFILAERPNSLFFVLSAPAERPVAEALAVEFPPLTAVRTRRMLEAVAIVARVDLLITVDTGMVPAATARDVPMVAMYSGNHGAYTCFGPQTVAHRAVFAERGRPLSDLEPEEVYRAVRSLMMELER